MATIEELVESFSKSDLPVLRQTMIELRQLRRKEDDVTPRELSKVILHDPLMTLKLLKFSQSRHRDTDSTEITTIEHVIMMHGTSSFFSNFSKFSTLEDKLSHYPGALDGVLTVISRAYHAASYAKEWAIHRHDIESDEITIAALLHDMAEILLWSFMPDVAMRIKILLDKDKSLRSVTAQSEVLGFPLIELQLALANAWGLPKLLTQLMDDKHARYTRALNVSLAVALARHSAHGWFDKALPDDYLAVQKFLNLNYHDVTHITNLVSVRAARAWKWYGVLPAATWLPLLPDANLVEKNGSGEPTHGTVKYT